MTDPAQLYGHLVAAFNQRQWQQVLDVAAKLLPLAPRHAGVSYITGVACMELQQMPAALGYLDQASQWEPARADFATQFAKALTMVRRTSEALEAADRALALLPDDPLTLDTLGVVYTQAHANERAAEAFRRAVRLAPRHAPYRFNLATALVATGDIEDAQTELEACIALDPTFWMAHLTLSQLRKQTAASNHIERLQKLLSAHTSDPMGQTYLHMALAKEHEDLAEHSRAFDHFTQGKAAGRAQRDYAFAEDEALFDALTRAFPAVQDNAAGGDPTDEPIFVIGMPRTGTTLVERIVSSHPDVYSAGELQNFGVALKRATGSRTPAMLDLDVITRAREVDWKRLGAAYLSSTRPATGSQAHFIDKLPHNFLYVGFIAKALPNARIICLRRDPIDTVLSNFRQLFAQKSPYYGYSFDLLDAGRYYVLFDRLMAHWKRVFPGRIFEIQYEALVASQEQHSRELLDFCGLPWHESVMHFEQNEAPVSTASAIQVRAPIYTSAVKRWKKYESRLGDLIELLEANGIRVER